MARFLLLLLLMLLMSVVIDMAAVAGDEQCGDSIDLVNVDDQLTLVRRAA